MEWNSVLRRAPRQVSCALRDEAAILNLATGTYFGLDPVAAFIWNKLDAPRTLRELRDALLAEYEVAPERCEEDLRRFMAELCTAGLAEVIAAGGARGANDDAPSTVAPTPGA
jgi:hypothetical protein